MLKWIKENIPICEKSAICRLVGLNLHIYHDLLRNKSKYKNEIIKIENNIKKYRNKIIFDKNVKFKIRAGILLSYFGFGILNLVMRMFRKNGEI
jgi:hypothetical protein